MKTTDYFKTSVMARRPYLKEKWIQQVLSNPIHTEVQSNGRIRRWAFIPQIGKYLRVVPSQMEKRCTMPSQTVASSPEAWETEI